MTDLPTEISVPSRLGVTARVVDEGLVLDLVPSAEVLRHGVVRASVIAYVVDVAAGVPMDDDTEAWLLTTDLSVRMRPRPAPELISAVPTIVRRGGRSAMATVDLTTPDGTLVAAGAAGFGRIPRRDGDPVKPAMPIPRVVRLFGRHPGLTAPLRDEAGVEVLDAAAGVVQVDVTPELRNPNGTLQGAMVALLAEAAVEDLVETRFGEPAVVVDLDLRYLARAEVGPVRTRCRVLGDGPGAPVEVTLFDTSAERVTTLVYARAVSPTRLG